MITHEERIRVRYGETDQMGFLYHARYIDYYDVARSELLRAMGSSNKELEATGVMLPVIEAVANYGKPAFYDDLLTGKVEVREMPAVRVRFDYEISRENGDVINTGHVTLAFMNAATRRACRGPKWFLDVFRPYFE